jgi:hypothetical protein
MSAALIFSGCVNFPELGRIDVYDDFLANLKHYSPPSEIPAPEIEGFTPIIDFGFDYGGDFLDDFAFAVYEENNLFLDKDGKLYYAPENLIGEKMLFNKYIFKDSGGFGVKTLDGAVLLEPLYADIDISGGLIVAGRQGGNYDIYYNKSLLHRNVSGAVAAYSDEYVLLNEELYYLDLTPVKSEGYSVVGSYVNGARIISDGYGAGFEMQDGSILPPVYSWVSNFNEFGFAGVADKVNGNIIIDKQGEIIYTEDYGFRPIAFDGDKIFYIDRYGFTAVCTASRKPVCGPFENLYAFKDYSWYLIYTPDNGSHMFFSLTNNSFVGSSYKKITPCGNYFVAVTPALGQFVLLDSGLNSVFGPCDYIQFDGEILVVAFEGRYYYYKS